MSVPEDGYPLQLRDELFALFLSCLGSGDPAAKFKKGVEAVSARTRGSWVKEAYVDDRSPRYEQALKEAAALPKELARREVHVARILFNLGLFFDCHEYLEPLWKESSGSIKRSLQGLIQAGAGFHKLELGSNEGCSRLLSDAADKLYDAPGAGLQAFAESLDDASAKASSGELTIEQAPRLASDGLDL
ncbi:MAG: DUF309 domain-containing protein [Elusimicrobia bacterium]|nr:DUF309 domain-containing protein [Elusimicrobiota bacterium]